MRPGPGRLEASRAAPVPPKTVIATASFRRLESHSLVHRGVQTLEVDSRVAGAQDEDSRWAIFHGPQRSNGPSLSGPEVVARQQIKGAGCQPWHMHVKKLEVPDRHVTPTGRPTPGLIRDTTPDRRINGPLLPHRARLTAEPLVPVGRRSTCPRLRMQKRVHRVWRYVPIRARGCPTMQ